MKQSFIMYAVYVRHKRFIMGVDSVSDACSRPSPWIERMSQIDIAFIVNVCEVLVYEA